MLYYTFLLFMKLGVFLEHVYMRPEVNSNRREKQFRLYGHFTAANLEMWNCFQKLFRLHGDFTEVTFLTIVRLYHTYATNISMHANVMQSRCCTCALVNNFSSTLFYCRHVLFTWNTLKFTEVKFVPKWVSRPLKSCGR